MTLSRLLPHELRSSLLVVLGLGLLLAPVALSLSPAAVVVGLFAGAVSIGVGIAGTDTSGRGTMPMLAHKALDLCMAAFLLVTAVAFGATGQAYACALFGAAGAAQLLISTNTRYSSAAA